jgi:hypothetical protein
MKGHYKKLRKKYCKNCYKKFETDIIKKTLCDECRKNIRKIRYEKRPKVIKNCKNCKIEFEGFSYQIFHNDKCREEYWRKKRKESYLKMRFEIFTRDNFTCRYCGKNRFDNPDIKLHVEHLKSKTKNGNNEENYVTSCQYCNYGKSDILLEKYLINKFIEKNKEEKK